MPIKRKTDLFRFVTLRSPQLLSEERRLLGFVENPDPLTSYFLALIDGIDDIVAARTALNGGIAGFTPFTKVSEVKAISEDVWNFSMWLAKNRNNIVRTELDARIPGTLPTAVEIQEIWDNVFYDILTRSSAQVRQACLQLLVGLNFIDKYAGYSPGTTTDPVEQAAEAELLKRLANGKVVVPRPFTIGKVTPQQGTFGFESKNYSKQETIHTAKLAGLEIAPLEGFKKEFIELGKTYKAEYKAGYDSAYAIYVADVKLKIAEYLASQPKLRSDANLEEQIPEGLIDDFVFSFALPLSRTYTLGKLTAAALLFVEEQCLEERTTEEAITVVSNLIGETAKKASATGRKRFSEILVNGVKVKPTLDSPKTFSMSFKEVPGPTPTHDVYMTLDLGYNGAYFKSSTFKVKIASTTYTGGSPKILSNKDNGVFAVINFPTLTVIPRDTEFTFDVKFDLNDGGSWKILKKGVSSVQILSGIAFADFIENEVNLYGVNRIGVADYRRVEQELCCYVAGEVSHIENILAKEFKEKSTRNLTSTETTIESITEREIEELNDTVTTTRHEMSIETAEIINKDREINFGFNTGADGKYPSGTWSASAYGDFAFGQSTSDSNASARTYAEDVTRRALERIVHKTTLKKTSRILREFEENNKHGFDNREGENHVTGVYRWIDKVYKNRIVNYGKRLLYEFMVPEPARFYKEAIIIEAEEEATSVGNNGATGGTGAAGKPKHPSEEGINSSADIQRANFASIAALYGASVNNPPEEFLSFSNPYTESIGSGDAAHSFPYPDKTIMIPIDYVCYQIEASGSYQFKSTTAPYGYINIITHGIPTLTNFGDSKGTGSISIVKPLSDVDGPVTIAVGTKKVSSYNFGATAKCKLKNSVFQTWQLGVYDAIISAYNQQLEAYNAAQAADAATSAADAAAAEQDETLSRNPRFNAGIVNTELKRLCIEMLTKPFDIPQGKDFYLNGECDVPQLKLGKELDVYASHVKFFEQAFDWELLSYIFYPYYWAKKCDWKALFQAQDGVDYIFQTFLQSGMGRVIVPVKEGFEDAVTYYIETGEVWNGTGIVIDTDDELYLSIVDEVTLIEGDDDSEEWETVVPTSLTILQARSVLLDEEGLPCCETDEDVIDALNLDASTNTLTKLDETP